MTDQEQGRFDGETCGSCELFYPGSDSQLCATKDKTPVVKQYPGPSHCGRFKPSLQCRQVRADEEANRLRREQNELLERIANAVAVTIPSYLADS